MASEGDKPILSALKTAVSNAVHPAGNVGTARKVRHPKGAYSFTTSDSANVVRYSELSQEAATRAWRDALAAWGISESNEKGRSAFRQAFVEAVTVSTSKTEESLDTQFKYDGNYYSLRVLHDVVAAIPGVKNDSCIRMFVRSYDHALFACMIFDYLNNAENVEIRAEIASRCGVDPMYAPYCFDTVGSIVRHSGRVFTGFELDMINTCRKRRTDAAQARAVDVGLPVPKAERSAKNLAEANNVGQRTEVSAPRPTRMNLAAVR